MALDKSLYNKNDLFIFDNLKGLAILLVFLHHCPFSREFALPFLVIVMPIFAFSTGNAVKQMKNFTPLYKSLFPLIFITVLSVILGATFFCLKHGFSISCFIEKCLSLILPVWYIFAIIAWTSLLGIFKSFRFGFIVSILVSILFFAIIIIYFKVNYFATGIRYICAFLPFFILGAFTDWKTIVKIRNSKLTYLLIPIFLTSIYCFAFKHFPYLSLSIKSIIVYFAFAFPSLLCVIGIFIGRKTKFLTRIGQRSMNIYVLHNVIAKVVLPYIFSFLCIDTSSYILRFFIMPLLVIVISIFMTSDIFTHYFNILLTKIKLCAFKD